MARSARAASRLKASAVVKPHRGDVEEREWRDPDDKCPLRRQARTVRGYRRTDTVALLLQRRSITRKHAAAAIRLRNDHELGELGARQGGERPEVRGTSGDLWPADGRLDALARYRGAMSAVGASLGLILVQVVLNGCSMTEWAEQHSSEEKTISVHQATGYFVAAMDLLVEHYGSTISLDELSDAEEI